MGISMSKVTSVHMCLLRPLLDFRPCKPQATSIYDQMWTNPIAVDLQHTNSEMPCHNHSRLGRFISFFFFNLFGSSRLLSQPPRQPKCMEHREHIDDGLARRTGGPALPCIFVISDAAPAPSCLGGYGYGIAFSQRFDLR